MNAARRAAAAMQNHRAQQAARVRQSRDVQVSAFSADETVNTTPALYIPHLAQGQGWTTYLDVINVCDQPTAYAIDFYGNDGELREFELGDGERYVGVVSGDLPLGNSIDTFLLQDTGNELIQGFGVVVKDGGGCIAVDTFYVQAQEDDDGNSSSLYATVPLQRLAMAGATLTFFNRGDCDTAMAIAGTGGSARLEAFGADGEALGSYSFLSLHHDAFSIGRRFPRTKDQLGMLRLSGEAALVGMDFCSGQLMQFRLPHLSPMPDLISPEDEDEDEEDPGPGPSKPVVIESFSVKLTHADDHDGNLAAHTFGIKLQIRNPNTDRKTYSAVVTFKDEDGFLVDQAKFLPGDTNGWPLRCAFCKTGLIVPAGQSQTFLGNIAMADEDGERVDLEQTTVAISEL